MIARSGIGLVLHVSRSAAGKTLDEAAEAARISRTSYHATEVGRRRPRPAELRRLATFLRRPELASLAGYLRAAAAGTPRPARAAIREPAGP